jgi:predicted dehydrogenase
VARYLVNAGPLPHDSWYRDAELEGSRFVGEGGHFVDTMSWWIGSDPVEVTAQCAGSRDDICVTLRYADGSLGTITYVVNGHPRFPKETFEAFRGGRSARLDNFRRATIWTGRRRSTQRTWASPDKGQSREIAAFLASVGTASPMPISLASLVSTTRATLGAAAGVSSRLPEPVAGIGPGPRGWDGDSTDR